MNQCGENDIHVISYVPKCFEDIQAHKKLKQLRKFTVKNTDKFFHLKYWIVEDEALARSIRINTQKPGDIYVLREAETAFNSDKPNVTICDYGYTSECVLEAEAVEANPEQSITEIYKLLFDAPVIVHNYL